MHYFRYTLSVQMEVKEIYETVILTTSKNFIFLGQSKLGYCKTLELSEHMFSKKKVQ